MSVEFASMLQPLGPRASYLRISGAGRNALDFHIAFYLGELLAKDPTAVFHIIAVDGGYDPLVQHLRDRQVFAHRHRSIGDIPHVKAANSKSLSAKVAFVQESLSSRATARPATLKTLDSTIGRMFPGGLAEDIRSAVIAELQSSGFLTVAGTKVTYG